LSSLSGAHNHHFTRVTDILSRESREDVLVIGGGIIPREDVPYLKEKGIKAIFGPGSRVKDIIGFIEKHVK